MFGPLERRRRLSRSEGRHIPDNVPGCVTCSSHIWHAFVQRIIFLSGDRCSLRPAPYADTSRLSCPSCRVTIQQDYRALETKLVGRCSILGSRFCPIYHLVKPSSPTSGPLFPTRHRVGSTFSRSSIVPTVEVKSKHRDLSSTTNSKLDLGRHSLPMICDEQQHCLFLA